MIVDDPKIVLAYRNYRPTTIDLAMCDGGPLRLLRIIGCGLLFGGFLSFAGPSFGQSMADTYRMAAQAYNNAAAQCQNPAGAMCMRQNAQYQLCLANQLGGGGSCGNPPTCSTACTGAGGSGSGGSGPLFTPSMSTNPKADAIGNLVGLGISLLMKDRSKEETPSPENNVDPAALAAEMAAAERQRRDAEASDILQQSNSLFESINGSSPQPATPSSTVNLDTLLDNGQPSDASTATINSLLDDSNPVNTGDTDPAAAVAGLLDQPAGNPDSADGNLSGPNTAIPSVEQLDANEMAAATEMGSDWSSAISKLKDTTQSLFQQAVDKGVDDAFDKALEPISQDPLEEGAKGVFSDILATSETHHEPTTLGDLIKDKFVDYAAEKTADFLIDKKDEMACSGGDSELDTDTCKVQITPLNSVTLGIKKAGYLLADRFANLWDKWAADPFGDSR